MKAFLGFFGYWELRRIDLSLPIMRHYSNVCLTRLRKLFKWQLYFRSSGQIKFWKCFLLFSSKLLPFSMCINAKINVAHCSSFLIRLCGCEIRVLRIQKEDYNRILKNYLDLQKST
jgi:hypothetical protein